MAEPIAGKTIAVTGANGFVGRALIAEILRRGGAPIALVRGIGSAEACLVSGARPFGIRAVGDIDGKTDWLPHIGDCDGVIHLAARVHVMAETASDPLTAFRTVNGAGTIKLARDCATAGIRRLVFASSIKVNGEETAFDARTGRAIPFTERDEPKPADAYGASKLEAETGLAELARETGLEVSIIRPPLVYGPGVGGNMRRLLALVRRGVPLPLRAIDNRRSLIGVGNLADLLILALTHPGAAGRTFLAADGRDLSTPDLIRALARGIGAPARLFPAPVWGLRLLGRFSGRSAEIDRLTKSLQVNIGAAVRDLGWSPPDSVDAGIGRMAAAFLAPGSPEKAGAASGPDEIP